MLSNFSNQYGIYLLFELSFIPPYPHPLKEYGLILSNKVFLVLSFLDSLVIRGEACFEHLLCVRHCALRFIDLKIAHPRLHKRYGQR